MAKAKTERPSNLRACAICMWVFEWTWRTRTRTCPRCGSDHSHGAYHVYGKHAYSFAKNQQPWRAKKTREYEQMLDLAVKAGLEKPKQRKPKVGGGVKRRGPLNNGSRPK